MDIKIVWTKEKKEQLAEAIEKWMIQYGVFSGEHLMQNDDCQITAPTLLADIIDDIIEPEVSSWEDNPQTEDED
jgi:hypothetical protein